MNFLYRDSAVFLIKAGAFFIPLIPLYIANSLFFPYITGKAFVFRVLVEIIFTAWVWLAIFYPEYRPRKTPLLVSVLVFLAVVTLATIFGINPDRSFWSNYERMEGLVAYLHLAAYFLVISHVFSAKGGSASGGKKSDWNIFLNIFIAAGLLENIYALIQKLGYLPSPQGGSRVDGTIGNPTYLAAYLIFILGFCLWLWLDSKSKKASFYYGGMSIFTLLTIYFTASRGPILAIFAGVFAVALFYLFLIKPEAPKEKFYKKLVVGALVALTLLPAGFWLIRDSALVQGSPVLRRFAVLSFSERTVKSRFTIWGMGLEGFMDKPILGIGPENYAVVFSKYYKPELWEQEPWFDRSHNIVLDWLTNAGILGFLSYFGILASAVYLLWKNYRNQQVSRELAVLLTVLLGVYVLQNFFVFDQIATYISYFAVLAYIQHITVSGTGNAQKVKPFIRPSAEAVDYGLITAGFLAIPLVLTVYFINARPFLANKSLLDALRFQNLRDLEGASRSYEKALAYNTLGRQEVREQFVRFAVNAGGLPNVSAEFKNKILGRAIEEAEKGVKENSLDPRAYLFLGSIYSRVGLLDPAIQVLNKAVELSPKKQQIYFELADAYLKKGENANAVKVLEKTFNDAPDFNQARMNLVAAYILNNQQDKADQLLLEAFKNVNVADQLLVQVYSLTKNYGRLLGIWQAFVAADPNNADYRIRLASAYLLVDDRDAAIHELGEAIRLNPGFKSEGEALIAEIRKGK